MGAVGLMWVSPAASFLFERHAIRAVLVCMKQMAGILLFVLVIVVMVSLWGCGNARGEDIDYELDPKPGQIFSTFQDKSVYSTDQDGNSAFTTFNGNSMFTTTSIGKNCLTTCNQFGCYTTCF